LNFAEIFRLIEITFYKQNISSLSLTSKNCLFCLQTFERSNQSHGATVPILHSTRRFSNSQSTISAQCDRLAISK